MLFDLSQVTKTYGSITALQGLSVAMPEGAIGLLGPNGAGKTTMIRTLLGLIRIDKGSGHVLGKDIRRKRLDIRQLVGFVPEDECLFPGVDGIGFVSYAGELAGMPSLDAMQRSHEVLDYVGLGEARYRKVDSYSTGMKQRLKIASAIVHDPKLLILDEPTNGMDPEGREEILELSRDLSRNKGMSLLFSSHLLPDVESVCEHVMVLARGKLVTQGRIDSLKLRSHGLFDVRVKGEQVGFVEFLRARSVMVRPIEDRLRLELTDGQGAPDIWRWAQEANEQIRLLRPHETTLEEVFFNALAETESA